MKNFLPYMEQTGRTRGFIKKHFYFKSFVQNRRSKNGELRIENIPGLEVIFRAATFQQQLPRLGPFQRHAVVHNENAANELRQHAVFLRKEMIDSSVKWLSHIKFPKLFIFPMISRLFRRILFKAVTTTTQLIKNFCSFILHCCFRFVALCRL